MEIQIKVLKHYTSQIDALRREAYYQNHPHAESKDEFDDVSEHICMFSGDELVGYTRYTAHTPSVLHNWDRIGSKLLNGKDYCNMTRSAINSKYQGGPFFQLLGLEDSIFAFIRKQKVLTVVEADVRHIVFLQRLGWEKYLEPVMAYKPPDGMTLSQYMLFDIDKSIDLVLKKRTRLIDSLLGEGVSVKSEIFYEYNNCKSPSW